MTVSPQVISVLASAFIHSGQSGDITDATVPFWPIRTFRRYYALWGHAIGDRGAAFRDRIVQSHFGKQLGIAQPHNSGLGMNRACSVLGLLGDPEPRPSIEIDARGILKVARNIQTCVICLI